MKQTIEELHRYLPHIQSGDRNNTRTVQVYGRFSDETTQTYFYAAEGQAQEKGGDYLYWGYAILPGHTFALQVNVLASDLKKGGWLGNLPPLTLDREFTPGTWETYKDTHWPPKGNQPLGRMRDGGVFN